MFLRALRRRQPGRPIWRILAWHGLHLGCFYACLLVYRHRTWGVRGIPDTGPLLFISNHQSFLDPVIFGLGAHRRHFFALMRENLLRFRFNRPFAYILNAIPVAPGEADLRAMRSCVEVLKAGQALIIFPEGARTPDGHVHPFETGAALVIKRARPTVVPVAIEGAYFNWPRGRFFPKFHGRLGVLYGQPIPGEELAAMKPAESLEFLRGRIESMRVELAGRLQRSSGRPVGAPGAPQACE